MADSFAAQQWLDDWLAGFPWPGSDNAAGRALIESVLGLGKAERLAIQKETVARLPGLRRASDEPYRHEKGSALYELVCRLYASRPSYGLDDVCTLLRASKHDCGHGADVKAPFEQAVRLARDEGLSEPLLAALHIYLDGLAGLRSIQARDLKAKGSLLLLLDPKTPTANCDGERFRAELFHLPRPERLAWERVVLHMGTAMGSRVARGYDDQVRSLVAFVGAERVAEQLARWLATPARLDTAGSHLFKNFVWALMVLASDPLVAPACDRIVAGLIAGELTPVAKGKKVLVGCAAYFAARPPALANQPLLALRERVLLLEPGEFDTGGITRVIDAALARPG